MYSNFFHISGTRADLLYIKHIHKHLTVNMPHLAGFMNVLEEGRHQRHSNETFQRGSTLDLLGRSIDHQVSRPAGKRLKRLGKKGSLELLQAGWVTVVAPF